MALVPISNELATTVSKMWYDFTQKLILADLFVTYTSGHYKS